MAVPIFLWASAAAVWYKNLLKKQRWIFASCNPWQSLPHHHEFLQLSVSTASHGRSHTAQWAPSQHHSSTSSVCIILRRTWGFSMLLKSQTMLADEKLFLKFSFIVMLQWIHTARAISVPLFLKAQALCCYSNGSHKNLQGTNFNVSPFWLSAWILWA